MWTALFWKDAIERVVATVAQVLIGVYTADGVDVLNVDLKGTLVAAGIAGGVALLKAIVGANRDGAEVSPASLL